MMIFFISVEVNDLGHQIADALQFELEYTNLLMCMMKGRAGQILGGGFSKRGTTATYLLVGFTNLQLRKKEEKRLELV